MKKFNYIKTILLIAVAIVLTFQSKAQVNAVGVTPFAAQIHNCDVATFGLNSTTTVTMAGFTVQGLASVTKNPANGLYYAIMKVAGGGVNRRLATINPTTGVCTDIGNLGDNFSSITFTTSGRCFGMTGSSLNVGNTLVPKTLYEINPTTASKSFRATLTNGADGQIIAFNPEDGMLYHWSGNVVNIMEKLDTITFVPVDIPQSGNTHQEVYGAVYKGDAFLVSDINLDLMSITTSGVNTTIANNSAIIFRGIAYAPCTVAPSAPSAITGPVSLCTLTSATYSVPYDPMATSYTWTVPTGTSGMTITSGQGKRTITVSISAGTVTGNVTCSVTNACGTSAVTSLAVSKKPMAPGAITGPTDICGLTSTTYSITAVSGATSYTWTVPAGMTISGGAGTNSINVNIASTVTTGIVKVMAMNACGSGPLATLAVYGKVAPTTLTGPTNVCGMLTANYTCNTVTNAVSYAWSVPGSWTITGQGTTSITATMPANVNNVTYSGVVRVHAVNTCGNSADKTLTVSYCKSGIAINTDETDGNSFSIYPNPATDELGIRNYESGIKNVEIYNVIGERVLQSSISNEQSTINISGLSKGMYFVKITDADGNKIYTQRVIKQ